MSKKTHFTTVTALPAGITRKTVMDTLHSHTEMIDLNPLVIDRHPIRPPPEATAEEAHCQWYSVSDKISYLPGVTGSLTFKAAFHDLPDGLQTHILAPMGLDMKGRWTLGGSLPGEMRQTQEFGLGLPKQGLWLKEDIEMRCNFTMTRFVRKTTEKSHATLVERLIEKSHIKEGDAYNERLEGASFVSSGSRNSGFDPPGYEHHTMSPLPSSMGSIHGGSPRVSAYSQAPSSSDGGAIPQQHYSQSGPHPAYTHQQLQQQAQAPSSYPPDSKHPYDPNTAFHGQGYPHDAKTAHLAQHPALQQQQQHSFSPQQQRPSCNMMDQHHSHSSYNAHGHPPPDPSLYPQPLHYQQQPPRSPPPQLSMEFAVELPGGEARTPMELDGGGAR